MKSRNRKLKDPSLKGYQCEVLYKDLSWRLKRELRWLGWKKEPWTDQVDLIVKRRLKEIAYKKIGGGGEAAHQILNPATEERGRGICCFTEAVLLVESEILGGGRGRLEKLSGVER